MPTVVGNREALAFELHPVTPNWERRYGPEVASWAGLAIWVGGRNICSHIEQGSVELSEHFFVPLGPIADWLLRSFPAIAFEERARELPTARQLHRDADRWGRSRPPRGIDEDSWLELREQWWSRHFLRAGSEGSRLPDLAFVRDDEELALSWRPPSFASRHGLSMRWPIGEFALPWDEAVETVRRFVALVAEWFREADSAHVYSWAVSPDPLAALETPLSTKVELYAARDMGDLASLFETDDPTATLEELGLTPESTDPAASPHCQMLRDLSPDVSRALAQVVRTAGRHALTDRPAAQWQQARAIALDAATPGNSPEESGQLAAIEIRRQLSLDGQPLSDMPAALSGFDIDAGAEGVGGQDRMVTAASAHGSPVLVVLKTRRTETPWGMRFEQARGLGHLLLDPLRAGTVGAASGAYAHAHRRRRSGAFAAELLLPTEALAKASDGRLDGTTQGSVFSQLLEQFDVGARTAAYQLWNQGWLSSAEVRDELIDRHALSP